METDLELATKIVEAAIGKLGLDAASLRSPSAGSHQKAWALRRGSASVLVTVTRRDEEKRTYLRVAAPVVTLPADAAKRDALMRRLLELNVAGLANAAFGLADDRVIAVSERPCAGLDAAEVEQIVRHLSAVADTFDDKLEREFGATKA